MASISYNFPGVHEKCKVMTWDDGEIPIENLKRGDKIYTDSQKMKTGRFIKVECVIKYTKQNNFFILPKACIRSAQYDRPCIVTQTQVFSLDKYWYTSNDIQTLERTISKNIYSIILVDRTYTPVIEDIPCVGIGQCFIHETLQHRYIHSEDIIHDLKKFPGWTQGFITLENKYFILDDKTRELLKIQYI